MFQSVLLKKAKYSDCSCSIRIEDKTILLVELNWDNSEAISSMSDLSYKDELNSNCIIGKVENGTKESLTIKFLRWWALWFSNGCWILNLLCVVVYCNSIGTLLEESQVLNPTVRVETMLDFSPLTRSLSKTCFKLSGSDW